MNKDKALSKLNTIANNNPKVGNALRNVGDGLDRIIDEQEKSRPSELNNSNDRYTSINGELLLIYFLMFVLMLTIACFILGVFLKRRLGSSNQTRNASINNSLHNFNTNTPCAYSSLGEKKTEPPQQANNAKRPPNEYRKLPTTNNNDSTNLNLNDN